MMRERRGGEMGFVKRVACGNPLRNTNVNIQTNPRLLRNKYSLTKANQLTVKNWDKFTPAENFLPLNLCFP
jgi:hypothetical protein